MHLKKGIGGDPHPELAESLLDPAPSNHHPGLGPKQGVGGERLKIEAHPYKRWPALHPLGRQDLQAIELVMTAHQGDQQLSAVTAESQRQMAQTTTLLAIAIDGPIAGLQIGFEGRNQGIQARIENRAVVHVDDPVGAAAVEPGTQAAVFAALERNDRPVSVAQALGGRH